MYLTRGNHETRSMNELYGFEGEVRAKGMTGFSKISPFLERVLMEHIDIEVSPESKLQISSIFSVKIRFGKLDIFEKPLQLILNCEIVKILCKTDYIIHVDYFVDI